MPDRPLLSSGEFLWELTNELLLHMEDKEKGKDKNSPQPLSWCSFHFLPQRMVSHHFHRSVLLYIATTHCISSLSKCSFFLKYGNSHQDTSPLYECSFHFLLRHHRSHRHLNVVHLTSHPGAYRKGYPGHPRMSLVSDCKWRRTVNL